MFSMFSMSLMSGCIFFDYHVSSKSNVEIPAGHNLDSITVKDGFVIDVQTHKRKLFEEPNCPRKFSIVEVKEKKD